MNRRDFLATTLTAGAIGSVAPFRRLRAYPRPAPNIVIVVVDDLRFDEYHAGGHRAGAPLDCAHDIASR